MKLLQFTKKGIYCAAADVYIDPWKPVHKALITHGHSDHARPGHRYYACSRVSEAVLKHRLGAGINVTGFEYGHTFRINNVRFSFHPAAHIVGSAQIRVEHKGEVWVVSGDYKSEEDGISGSFEVVPCHHFITECTFGLPVYRWPPQEQVFREIDQWWAANRTDGKITVLSAYSLGKAQRILHNMSRSIGEIYVHSAIDDTNQTLQSVGVHLPPYHRLQDDHTEKDLKGQLVLMPPMAVQSTQVRKWKHVSIGAASGWMALRGMRRRRGADRGFVLSDHCDWDGLNEVIRATGAEYVYPTHGYTEVFTEWLRSQGYYAQAENTEFEGNENML